MVVRMRWPMWVAAAAVLLAGCGSAAPVAGVHPAGRPAHTAPGRSSASESAKRSKATPKDKPLRPIKPSVHTSTTPAAPQPSVTLVGTPVAGSTVVIQLDNIPPGYVLITLTMDEGPNTVATPLVSAEANGQSQSAVGFSVSPDGSQIHFQFDTAMGGGTGQFVFTLQNSAGQTLTVKSAPFSIQAGG
jgi:hypothetical protein